MRDFKKEQIEFNSKLKERMNEKGCNMYVAYMEVCEEMEEVKESVSKIINNEEKH